MLCNSITCDRQLEAWTKMIDVARLTVFTKEHDSACFKSRSSTCTESFLIYKVAGSAQLTFRNMKPYCSCYEVEHGPKFQLNIGILSCTANGRTWTLLWVISAEYCQIRFISFYTSLAVLVVLNNSKLSWSNEYFSSCCQTAVSYFPCADTAVDYLRCVHS